MGRPIKYVGVGEKLANLEAFHPERMASRVLGMGDVLSLVEEAHRWFFCSAHDRFLDDGELCGWLRPAITAGGSPAGL